MYYIKKFQLHDNALFVENWLYLSALSALGITVQGWIALHFAIVALKQHMPMLNDITTSRRSLKYQKILKLLPILKHQHFNNHDYSWSFSLYYVSRHRIMYRL
jgi:hypothetical protein